MPLTRVNTWAGVCSRSCRGDAVEHADGEAILLGNHLVRWLDAPHVPHAWECGFLMEERTSTLLCGDLFIKPRIHQGR
ncbi:hypothetical protein ThimaDRAFT_4801 [Thiocapsa marina 5811]|uniref:Uncharacterized protein n=1 Tax=Thiocapsa marina 5811 TaxID=768671 RepID=F9UIP8_9GAMM|nr:hypothetical protein ThimaDRAFT_4801 [Thiocapsa marina 5811]